VTEVIHKKEPTLEEQKRLVKEKHAEGHVGADLLFRTLFKDGFYWRTMYKDCESESEGCLECLRFNIGRVGFHPISPVLALLPFDHVGMDFLGPFNTSIDGFNYILLVVDVLTRFVILRPLRAKLAEEVAWTLLCIFADFGVPKIIQSDSDRSFFNAVMTALREMAGFEQRRIMKYFPQANGLPERFVQETKRLLEKWNRGDWIAWNKRVPALQMTLNDRIISFHKSRPFAVLFARQFNGFDDFRNAEGKMPSFEYLEERNEKLIKAVFPAIAELEKQNAEMKAGKLNAIAEAKRKCKKRLKKFKVGDIVMKLVDVREGSVAQRWEGPFTIVEEDAKQKAYRLLNSMGRLVSGFIPAPKLRIVRYASDADMTGFSEIKAIKAHRGTQGNREYLVQWKKKGADEWVHELDCDAYDLIREYWVKIAKEKKDKGKEAEVVEIEEPKDESRPATPPLVIQPLQPTVRRVTRVSNRRK
jgi:hypothetical protein